MDDAAQIAAGLSGEDGPRVDEYHNRELPDHAWASCHGCPSLRVFDFHYFYCRRLGDQAKPDEWNVGWARLSETVWNEEEPAPCGLSVRRAREGL